MAPPTGGQDNNLIDLMGDAYSFHAWYLQKFAIRLKEVQPSYRFSNRNIFQNLLPVITGENEQDRLLALVKFYDFLDEPFQNQLVEAIRENLKISVGLDGLHLYFDARFAGCIPQEAFPEKVREAIKRFFGKISQIRFTSSGEIEPFNTVSQFSGEPLPHNYALIVTQIGRMHAIGGIDKKDLAWLRSQSDLPTCIRWLLAPKSFDYSQFDHHWLFFLGRADVTLKNLQSQNISELREAIQKGLHERFSEKVSEMYFGYLYVSK